MATLRPDSQLVNDPDFLNKLKHEWERLKKARVDDPSLDIEQRAIQNQIRELALQRGDMGSMMDLQARLEEVSRKIVERDTTIGTAYRKFKDEMDKLEGQSDAPEPGPAQPKPKPDIVEPTSRESMYARSTARPRNPTSGEPAGQDSVPIGGSPTGRRSTTRRVPPSVRRGGRQELNNSTLKF